MTSDNMDGVEDAQAKTQRQLTLRQTRKRCPRLDRL